MEETECEIAANGGINCGWDGPDHKDFLRVRTKYQNKTLTVAFITEMARTVPTADEVSVREHCHAYDKWVRLCQEKKELIQKYKDAKEKERISKMTNMNSDKNFTKLNSDLNLQSGPRRSSQARGVRAGSLGMQERQNLKNELAEWKRKKLDRDREVDHERLQADQAHKDRLKRKLEQERLMKREMVEEYKY